MIREITSTVVQCARTAELCDKQEGYPARSLQADGSSSPRVPLEWDRTGAVPFGWTSHRGVASGAVFSIATGRSWLIANGPAPLLTSAERTELITLLQPARRFSSRWSARFW
jgi:hypothetical protein